MRRRCPDGRGRGALIVRRACPRAWHPRTEPPRFARSGYPRPVLRALTDGWRALLVDERRAVSAAAMVAADLARLGAPADILGAATRLIEDEVRHVEVCGRVLERLGGAPPEGPSPHASDHDASDDPLEERCARWLVAGFGVGEPLSAACFAAAPRRAREPLIRWALTELLRDEARHGPFGMEAGGWVVRHWPRASRRALWPACVDTLERFERAVGGPPAPPPPGATPAHGARPGDDARAALGMLSAAESRAAVAACVPRWILPSLAELGVIDAGADRPRAT
jgi:hypothetical protein